MFYVWKFDGALEDFVAIGAFSNKAEADALRDAAPEGEARFVLEQDWRTVIDSQVQAALGAAPWPATIWLLHRRGAVLGVFLDECSGRDAFRASGEGASLRSMVCGLFPPEQINCLTIVDGAEGGMVGVAAGGGGGDSYGVGGSRSIVWADPGSSITVSVGNAP